MRIGASFTSQLNVHSSKRFQVLPRSGDVIQITDTSLGLIQSSTFIRNTTLAKEIHEIHNQKCARAPAQGPYPRCPTLSLCSRAQSQVKIKKPSLKTHAVLYTTEYFTTFSPMVKLLKQTDIR